ncbi:MAG: FAD-binding oxidoreductase [Chloroflexi bacterium]|nr:FAD-binding oxidoreductase [Chloroflexota bacterium]
MKITEIIIIGAGVIGCSIAYHLAKMGCHDVIILERDYIGSGSTEKCAGGIRQQFSTETNVKLSIESVRFFERFEAEISHHADFRQNGYLMLATTEDELESFRQNIALQRRLGAEVQLLSPQEAKEIVPRLNIGDVLGAAYCPTDGYADPYSVVQGFASAARELRTKIYQETEVTDIKKTGQVWEVLTKKGGFQSPIVVIASGAWSGKIGKMVGLDIPVHPSRRHIFVTAPLDAIRKDNPMVVDFHNGFWFRREGPGLIFGMRNPDEPEGFDTSVDWSFLPNLAEIASHRLPFLKDIGVVRAQAGLHEDTPDANAIIGKVPEMDGLYLACGFSGHGFMHSPAVGRIVAGLVLEKSPTPELLPFTLERFKLKTYQKERYFI